MSRVLWDIWDTEGVPVIPCSTFPIAMQGPNHVLYFSTREKAEGFRDATIKYLEKKNRK